MRIYVAGSWQNGRYSEVVEVLRHLGHDVRAPMDRGFQWASEEQLRDGKRFRDEALVHPVASATFREDVSDLSSADMTVLVLPSGKSAHLELGYAVASGQKTYVLLDEPVGEPELMYLLCTRLVTSLQELSEEVGKAAPPFAIRERERSTLELSEDSLPKTPFIVEQIRRKDGLPGHIRLVLNENFLVVDKNDCGVVELRYPCLILPEMRVQLSPGAECFGLKITPKEAFSIAMGEVEFPQVRESP